MEYWRRYVPAFRRNTSELDMLERGAYGDLLDEYYDKNGKISNDLPSLYRACRATTPTEKKAVRRIAEEFFPINGDGRRHNVRADQELGIALPAIEKMSKSGKEGAEKRWAPHRAPHEEPHSPPHRVGDRVDDGVAMQPCIQEPNLTTSRASSSGTLREPAVARVAALRSLCDASRIELGGARGLMHLGQWASEGVTDQELANAIGVARERKPDPEVIPVRYLLGIMADLRAGRITAPQATGDAAIAAAITSLQSPNPEREALDALWKSQGST